MWLYVGHLLRNEIGNVFAFRQIWHFSHDDFFDVAIQANWNHGDGKVPHVN